MGQGSSKEDYLIGYTKDEKEVTWKDIELDKQQQIVHLSKRNLYSITPHIGLFTMIKRIDLSYNSIRCIPEAIGHLHHLEYLNLSHNQLMEIPDTLSQLSRLKELDLSYNKLQRITRFIGDLDRLQSINLEHNQLTELPFTIEGLLSLTTLDVSHNPIIILPAPLIQLPYLRRIQLDGCPLTGSVDFLNTPYNPPSLVEICARLMTTAQIECSLTETLDQYVSSYEICNYCRGPYFESFVSRGRWIKRNDVWIPLEYRLCSAHWFDESDRVIATFATAVYPRASFCKKQHRSVFKVWMKHTASSSKSR
ncbi:hypothetical protein CU097_002084 [Rhizopus azygosporus]|uniref:L domain-like protein n=2 Tax=Rhizopus TaxID=4842 RepID=A0A367J0F7_RHIAZ|nr:L domain-like protein [Rhizopus microsporus]RCH83417.1 hypothetical protein CU097_002084 [Rhizopus azygosporus]CEI92218.1 hypothetical protein RMCBS344292_06485 [Rhizopus microsporus]